MLIPEVISGHRVLREQGPALTARLTELLCSVLQK